MPAAEYNFSIEKGAVFYISFEYKDATNTVINLTNWCARISVESADPGIPVTSFTYISDSITPEYSFTIEPEAGRVILQLSALTTQSFNFSTAKYDLDLRAPNELYPGSGPQIIKLLKGFITVISSNVSNPQPFDCNVIMEDPCLTFE